ncbi:hypothetical protein K1719_028015 [Acacia pycnantha]|nr:hypothetical protein K1719_028015 [Acacia pycnantha]
MKPLQSKCLAIKEQYSIVFLLFLATPLKCDFMFSDLVIMKFHRDPIFLGLANSSSLLFCLKRVCQTPYKAEKFYASSLL